jgi:ADP-ribose pyrophosphatase
MEYFPSPGALQERVFLFLATIDSSQAAPVCGREDEGEDIRTRVLSFEEALSLTHHGAGITSASTIISLQYLEKMILKGECP